MRGLESYIAAQDKHSYRDDNDEIRLMIFWCGRTGMPRESLYDTEANIWLQGRRNNIFTM